jgi:hypothetical protein
MCNPLKQFLKKKRSILKFYSKVIFMNIYLCILISRIQFETCAQFTQNSNQAPTIIFKLLAFRKMMILYVCHAFMRLLCLLSMPKSVS